MSVALATPTPVLVETTLDIGSEFLGHHEACIGSVHFVSTAVVGERLCFRCGMRGPDVRLVSEVFSIHLDENLDISKVAERKR